MILLGLEIVMTLILLIMPGDPSVIVVCIIAILAFACFMYALRGVYYATLGEAGVPIAMTGTATGIISVIGNAFPREFSRMVRLALQGDYANALTIHHKFAELFKLLFVDGNPAGVKAMLNAMGMIENKLRLPLVPTRITTFEAMRKILDELNIKC